MSRILFSGGCWLWLALASLVQATVYEVGPGQPLAHIGDVPWEKLEAGDTVLIHARPEPYREKWVICRRGTEAQPITVRGVPGPKGELPVIDGRDAATPPQLHYWSGQRSILKIGGATSPADTMPAWIVVENLDLRSARPPYRYRGEKGEEAYVKTASAIYVEKGEHITVRHCTLHDCGNGLFTSFQSQEILIESCWIYDNGNEGSIYEHNSYTAARGITFQYNHYGPLRTGCPGNNLKDRSAGLVVRYNWIESGNRELDLVDAEDAPVVRDDPRYHSTFVYGNLLLEPDGAGNRQIVHYGGDSGKTDWYRKGTLYFFNNTVISQRRDGTTLFRLSSEGETADCRDNIVYVTGPGDSLALLDATGKLMLRNNWLKPGWRSSFGRFSGFIADAKTSVTGAAPGFVNEAGRDFRLAPHSPCLGVGAAWPSELDAVHRLTREYRPDQQGQDRAMTRTGVGELDLGAFGPAR